MLKNSVSRVTDMNVFGSSVAGETKKFISNLEVSIKSFSSKLDKFEHLLEENNKSVQIQEEQIETLQLTCVDVTERIKKIELSILNIIENTNALNKIIPAILSQLNTIESYYKDRA